MWSFDGARFWLAQFILGCHPFKNRKHFSWDKLLGISVGQFFCGSNRVKEVRCVGAVRGIFYDVFTGVCVWRTISYAGVCRLAGYSGVSCSIRSSASRGQP